MPTVLITGCSTGFGRAIAEYFLQRDFNVVATMRDPADSTLPDSERLRVLPLDVTDSESISACISEAGRIDVLINNAGIGWFNALEGTPMSVVRRIFETNLYGTIAMMQAVLPKFRERGSGVIVNVGSSTTLKSLPFLSVYTASKAAINGLTGSAAIELAQFGIRLHVVLPGAAPETSFSSNAQERMAENGGFPPAYAHSAEDVLEDMQNQDVDKLTHPEDVVQAVWRAATDVDAPLRLPAGADAVALFEEG